MVFTISRVEREEKVLALFAEGAKKCGTPGFELSRHAVRVWVSAVRTSNRLAHTYLRHPPFGKFTEARLPPAVVLRPAKS